MPAVRQALRDSRKLRISHVDGSDAASVRTVWPLGLYLFSHMTLVCAWCELRDDYRAFRSERIAGCEVLADRFDPKGGALMSEFLRSFAAKI